MAIKLETARYEIRALRRAEGEREAALALRKATPDWADLDRQLKQLELETEMDVMEACSAGSVSRVHFSPDGEMVYFLSRREGRQNQ